MGRGRYRGRVIRVLLALLFGGLVGAALGGLGGGGSILIIPALVYGLEVAPQPAVVNALAVVGATSLFASFVHWRQGHVRLLAAAIFAVVGAGGAYVGAIASHAVPGRVLLVALAILMAVVSVLMFRSGSGGAREDDGAGQRRGAARHATVALAALAVGFLTGFLGVGGGFLIVPALTLVARLPVKEAIGTSLLVIAANCASGLAAHRAAGFDPSLTASFLAGSLGASYLASRLVKDAAPKAIKKAFAGFILLIAAMMLVDNLVLRNEGW